MTGPLVSIITPCYNAGRFIGNAIESVLAQNVPYQLIIVDDGSTDDTQEVVARYRGNIEVLHGDHSGVANARNRALAQIRGRYVLLLDADDSLEPGALHSLVNAVSGTDQIVYGGFTSWDAGMQRRLAVHAAPRLLPHPFISLSRGNFSPPGAMLFPRGVFDAAGIFDQAVAGCEDWDFLIRAARSGFRFRRISRPVFNYRRHTASASNQAYKMYCSGREVVFRCHRGEPRLSRDAFPEGNIIDSVDDNLLRYAASCLALAVLSGDEKGALQILQDVDPARLGRLKPAGRCYRLGLVWYSLALEGGRKARIREAMGRTVELVNDYAGNHRVAGEILKVLLYPDFGELLRRPGPKKARRMLGEWLQARHIMAGSVTGPGRNAG